MRRFSFAILLLRLFNAATALAVLYVTLVYFISPVETKDYTGLRDFRMAPAPPVSGAGPRTPDSFRAVWETPMPVRLVVAEAAPVVKPEAPPPPDLEALFTLTGTIASDDPRAGMAVVTVNASKEMHMLAADTNLPGTAARITGVLKDHIVVQNAGKEERLFVKDEIPAGPPDPRDRRARPSTPSSRPALPPVDPRSFRTERDTANPNKWNVDRNEKQYLMKNLDSLRDQMGIRPVMAGGQMSGVQIESIKPDSILSDRGLSTGDIIRKINGIAITSEDQGNQLMANPNIRNAGRYDLEIERAGQVFTVTYQINR